MRRVARDEAPFHGERGVFGNDVQDRATFDGADMDGGVRRIEAVLERAFGRQAASLTGDPGDRLAGRLHGVDALRRVAGMPGQTAHGDVDVEFALMRQDRLHAGRFADHAQVGSQAGLVHILDQPLRASQPTSSS